jgi:hypothetical protein
MKPANNRSNMATICSIVVLCAAVVASSAYGQDNKIKVTASKTSAINSKIVTVGAFSINVPTDWTICTSGEAASLRLVYLEQGRQMFQQFDNTSEVIIKSFDLAAFHILGDKGEICIVSFTVPPRAGRIPLLENQVGAKMDWCVREGKKRKYLGMVKVMLGQLSGFYTKAIGKSGYLEVTGTFEYKNHNNTILQLILIPPKSWNETEMANNIAAVLKSAVLKSNSGSPHASATR